MNKLKLCNVHKLAIANEGEQRKPIHIPFGTWSYDDTIDQTLDREHAEAIAADLSGKIAAGEPGIPVYQGHPDVPEYAGKYPDKGALGWVKKILVNEDGMDLEVEWDRDPGKGFGWFSPYWTGDDPGPGASGKRNVIVDGLTSIGLVNNPNIREFRLANEAGENLTQRRGGAEFKMPQHLIDLAKRFDGRAALANVVDANGAGHGADGKFDGSGSGGGGGGSGGAAVKKVDPKAWNDTYSVAGSAAALAAAQADFDTAKSELIAEQKRGWSKEENDKATRRYLRTERKLKIAKDHDRMIRASSGPGRPKEPSTIKESDFIPHPVLKQQETKKKLDALWAELGRRFDERRRFANEYDESKHPRSEDGKWTSGGGGGTPKGLTFKDSEGQLNSVEHSYKNYKATGIAAMSNKASRGEKAEAINGLIDFTRKERKEAKGGFKELFGTEESGDDALRRRRSGRADVKGLHAAAISAGLKYNRATHHYE